VIQGSHELIIHRFLSPLFTEISKNYATSLKMKNIVHQWIEGHENGVIMNEYIQLLKDKNILFLFFPSEIVYLDRVNNDEVAAEDTTKICENGCEKRNNDLVIQNLNGDIRKFLRKRKADDISYQETIDESSCSNEFEHVSPTSNNLPKSKKKKYSNYSINVKKSNYEIIHFLQNGIPKSRLFLFNSTTTTNRKQCYEYHFQNQTNKFYCSGCHILKRNLTAKLCERKNPEENNIRLNSADHICQMREYNPEKYKVKQEIIKSPNFQIFSYNQRGSLRKRLIIFDSKNSKLCHEYFWHEKNKNFVCCGCASGGFAQKKQVKADICQDENGMEYVKLGKRKHPIKFELPKIVELKIVKSPNFQYINRKANGKIVQHLVIFDSDNRNLCYEYTRNKNSFICYPCSTKFKTHVRAKIKRNENGEEYVELSVNEHKCDLQKFVSEEANILKEPDFKLDKYTRAGIEKMRILVFDKIDKNYYFVHTLKESNIYMCHPCRKLGNHASVRLCKNENGENYIEVKGEHLCSPRNKF
uniref:Uncharacterized protein n=1 Tax=Panagrolaimus sp. ES5 TaxID=591445 RepID=A0AC34FMU0_9BILA